MASPAPEGRQMSGWRVDMGGDGFACLETVPVVHEDALAVQFVEFSFSRRPPSWFVFRRRLVDPPSRVDNDGRAVGPTFCKGPFLPVANPINRLGVRPPVTDRTFPLEEVFFAPSVFLLIIFVSTKSYRLLFPSR